MPDLLVASALVAAVLTITALASGLVERSPLSFPLIFLGFGLALGSGGFGFVEMEPTDPTLEIVATLTLCMVLFLDGVQLQIDELGRRWVIPALVLGPGTGLIIAAGAVVIVVLFEFGWVVAFIGGAVLASTDPVVLREIVRDERIPRSVRQVLKIEAGTNDVVVLPVVMVLIAVAGSQIGGLGGWASFLAKLLVLGPVIGFAIGGLGSWLMARVDAKTGVRREYQALYGVGLVLAAYAGATAVDGDGFLAAFAAGLGVVLLNQTLCDCFLEFGETTSEMAMLLSFVLFGIVLSGILDTVSLGPALALAALAVFVIRPSALGLVLARARMSWEAHLFVSWFGPRGLNSLLLTLLVVHAGVAGAELLLATVGVVVLASIAVHGATAIPSSAWYERRVLADTHAEERESTAAGLFGGDSEEAAFVTPSELDQMLRGPSPPIVLDVRSRSSFEREDYGIPGSERVPPDRVSEWGVDRNRERPVVAYCS